YVGDVHIDVEVKKFFCKAGVKGMQLHGMLRVILEPLLGDVPIVGALSLFFIRRPVSEGLRPQTQNRTPDPKRDP
ncbi:hypothetical protein HGM15179_021978, partial [Zosterops borbonicus]